MLAVGQCAERRPGAGRSSAARILLGDLRQLVENRQFAGCDCLAGLIVVAAIKQGCVPAESGRALRSVPAHTLPRPALLLRSAELIEHLRVLRLPRTMLHGRTGSARRGRHSSAGIVLEQLFLLGRCALATAALGARCGNEPCNSFGNFVSANSNVSSISFVSSAFRSAETLAISASTVAICFFASAVVVETSRALGTRQACTLNAGSKMARKR